MTESVSEILKNYSVEELEKMRVLLSIMKSFPQMESLKTSIEQTEIVTVRVFVEEYKTLIKETRSPAYHKSVCNALKHFTDFFGLQRSMQSIGFKDIESFITYLKNKVKKGYRVYYRTLKAAFNKAIDWEFVKENYFLKIKLAKKQQVNPAYIDERQLTLICRKIDVDVVREVVILAFYTGMRLNELLNLSYRNINLTARIITVGDEYFTSKGRNQRYIPICDEAMEIITRRLSRKEKEKILPIGNSFVFCKSNGERYTGDYISRRFKLACYKAGIDASIHFHSLRHSFASNLAQKGVSLYTIKELLGHSSIATTEIYSHLNMESLKEAIKTFDLIPSPKEKKDREINFDINKKTPKDLVTKKSIGALNNTIKYKGKNDETQ